MLQFLRTIIIIFSSESRFFLETFDLFWLKKLLNKSYYSGEQSKFNICLIMSGFVNRPLFMWQSV